MKSYILIFITIFLVACGADNTELAQSSLIQSKLQSNEEWPYKVSGIIEIIDAGVGDEDYASWAVGSITINGTEEVSIDFETSVLEKGDIDLEFKFDEPANVLLGKPKKEYGGYTYPVVQIL
jgi:hypothetical protein